MQRQREKTSEGRRRKERKNRELSTTMQSSSRLSEMFEKEDEFEAVSTLLQLPLLIAQSESSSAAAAEVVAETERPIGTRAPPSLTWGAKRRRSADETSASPVVAAQPQGSLPSPSLPQPVPVVPVPSTVPTRASTSSGDLSFKVPATAPASAEPVKVQALSPTAPRLSFSLPSRESGERSKSNGGFKSKPSVAKRVEECCRLDRGSISNGSYKQQKQEILNWQHGYEQLRLPNVSLIARKEELVSPRMTRQERGQLEERKSSDLDFRIGQEGTRVLQNSSTPIPDHEDHHHLPIVPGIADRTAAPAINLEINENYPQMLSFSSRSSRPSNTGNAVAYGSGVIFGQNLLSSPAAARVPMWGVEFVTPRQYDSGSFSKALAAQARQRRMQICKSGREPSCNKAMAALARQRRKQICKGKNSKSNGIMLRFKLR